MKYPLLSVLVGVLLLARCDDVTAPNSFHNDDVVIPKTAALELDALTPGQMVAGNLRIAIPAPDLAVSVSTVNVYVDSILVGRNLTFPDTLHLNTYNFPGGLHELSVVYATADRPFGLGNLANAGALTLRTTLDFVAEGPGPFEILNVAPDGGGLRLTWTKPPGRLIGGYRIEGRFRGVWTTIGELDDPNATTFLDESGTYVYGPEIREYAVTAYASFDGGLTSKTKTLVGPLGTSLLPDLDFPTTTGFVLFDSLREHLLFYNSFSDLPKIYEFDEQSLALNTSSSVPKSSVPATGAAISPDGSTILAYGYLNGKAVIHRFGLDSYDLASQCFAEGMEHPLTDWTLVPTGESTVLLAMKGRSPAIEFDSADCTALRSIALESGVFRAAASNVDNNLLVTIDLYGLSDYRIRVRTLDDPDFAVESEAAISQVSGAPRLSLNSDGSYLAVATSNGTELWTTRPLERVGALLDASGFRASVSGHAMSSRYLFAKDFTGLIFRYELPGLTPVDTYRTVGLGNNLYVSPDEKLIVVGGGTKLWVIPVDKSW
ncbi:MAG: hypothetical protein R2832_14550 [Rhodothermales bacterium]